jgi:hypothetical protein
MPQHSSINVRICASALWPWLTTLVFLVHTNAAYIMPKYLDYVQRIELLQAFQRCLATKTLPSYSCQAYIDVESSRMEAMSLAKVGGG